MTNRMSNLAKYSNKIKKGLTAATNLMRGGDIGEKFRIIHRSLIWLDNNMVNKKSEYNTEMPLVNMSIYSSVYAFGT